MQSNMRASSEFKNLKNPRGFWFLDSESGSRGLAGGRVPRKQVHDPGFPIADQFTGVDHRISGVPERALSPPGLGPFLAKMGGSLIVLLGQCLHDEPPGFL